VKVSGIVSAITDMVKNFETSTSSFLVGEIRLEDFSYKTRELLDEYSFFRFKNVSGAGGPGSSFAKNPDVECPEDWPEKLITLLSSLSSNSDPSNFLPFEIIELS